VPRPTRRVPRASVWPTTPYVPQQLSANRADTSTHPDERLQRHDTATKGHIGHPKRSCSASSTERVPWASPFSPAPFVAAGITGKRRRRRFLDGTGATHRRERLPPLVAGLQDCRIDHSIVPCVAGGWPAHAGVPGWGPRGLRSRRLHRPRNARRTTNVAATDPPPGPSISRVTLGRLHSGPSWARQGESASPSGTN
jgi:hypothetical protein